MGFYQKLQAWCTTNFRPLFFLLAGGLVITTIMMNKNSWMLASSHLPAGIISWELNPSNGIQRAVLSDWKNHTETIQLFSDSLSRRTFTGLKVADDQNTMDYFFIGLYVFLFFLIFLRLAYHRHIKSIGLFAGMILLAGLTDVLEDWGTHRAILAAPDGINSLWIFLPALIKWVTIALLLIYLVSQAFHLQKWNGWIKELSDNLIAVLILMWRFRIVLITLILYFLVLFLSDQGQDLLITINSTRKACICFLFTVTILALLCWHLPKAIDNAKQITFCQFWFGKVDFKSGGAAAGRPSAKIDIGRLLGALAFLIPAAGILQTMQKYHMDYFLSEIPPISIPFIFLAIYTIILRYHLIDRIYKKGAGVNRPFYWISMGVIFALIIYWGLDDAERNTKPYYLVYLSLDLLLLSLAFLITTTLRTCDIVLGNWKITPWITVSGVFLGLIFLSFNIRSIQRELTLIDRFWTMPVVFCGIAGYLLFFAFLMYLGKRRGVQYVSLLLVIMTCFAVFKITDYHNILVEHDPRYTRFPDSLETYATRWLENRRPELETLSKNGSKKPYPVFFVNAFGGGIRATAWTAMVMGSLDSLVIQGNDSDPSAKNFEHYVFSYSGASGGSIGLSLVVASSKMHLDCPGKDRALYPNRILKVFQYDYLTADIVALLGRDAWASGLGLSAWKDRGRLQEEDWERHCGNLGIPLGVKLGELQKNTRYELPLFFPNTHDAKVGKKGVIAPVLVDSLDFPGAVFVASGLKKGDDIRLSTAAFLSARFPYVSPTAKLYGEHNFTDGGTWDNSGAETSAQVYRVFARALERLSARDTVYRQINIQFLSLPNSVPILRSHAPVHLFEPLVPPIGLVSLINTVAEAREGDNKSFAFRKNYGYTQIMPEMIAVGTSRRVWPVLPLGWQISDFALEQMQKSVAKNKEAVRISQLCRSVNAITRNKH